MTITFVTNFFISDFWNPPFSGFFSKDEILMVALSTTKYSFIASLSMTFYMFRLLYLTFFKEFRGTARTKVIA
jgi:NADH-quinone oxidoreductase subunit L